MSYFEKCPGNKGAKTEWALHLSERDARLTAASFKYMISFLKETLAEYLQWENTPKEDIEEVQVRIHRLDKLEKKMLNELTTTQPGEGELRESAPAIG